jgi:hypothetical protein
MLIAPLCLLFAVFLVTLDRSLSQRKIFRLEK